MSGRWLPSARAAFRRLDDDEAIILDLEGQEYFGLDAVGTRLWELLLDDPSLDRAVAVLLDEFEVTEATLRRDLAAFLARLEERGLVARPEGGSEADDD